jgi:hypothetical protein
MAVTLPIHHQDPLLSGTRATSKNEPTVTVLLATFAGLGLPRTLSLPVTASTTIHSLLETIYSRLPRVDHALIITTTSNKQLQHSNYEPIASLLSSAADTFLPLRLSVRLCGGKGGFGSQLRAAGGRMSSRKSRNQQDRNPNGSNRNLDGRRLRTVAAAKLLADHLASKSDDEKKEKEARRQRWEDNIEAADKKMEQIKSGRMGSGQGRLDAEYVESKEAAEEKTREAVINAMKAGMVGLERTGSESSMEVDDDASGDEDVEEGSSGSSDDVHPDKPEASAPSFFGWDEEDEDDEDDEDGDEDPGPEPTYEGKGKAKVT